MLVEGLIVRSAVKLWPQEQDLTLLSPFPRCRPSRQDIHRPPDELSEPASAVD
jgi:hypothetical protein